MGKVVYNACYGGFSLSDEAVRRYAEIKGLTANTLSPCDIARADPALVQVVEELGSRAGGRFAKLAIAVVPTGALYRIDEYDGSETVMMVSDYDWLTMEA